MAIAGLEHELFAGAFRFAVRADRFGRVVFDVRRALFAIKNVVGAEMNEFCVLVRTDFSQDTRCFGIDRERLIGFGFAKIDIGKGSRVDQNIKIKLRNIPLNFIGLGEIELRVIEVSDVELFAISTLRARRQVDRLNQ